MQLDSNQLLPDVAHSAKVEERIEAHLPALRAYVRANLGPLVAAKESASDLVQSTCREVLEHLERCRYDGEVGFERWLYATALRKIQDRRRFFRAVKRDAAREVAADARTARLEELFQDSATPSRSAARRDELARVERVLSTLPARYAEVIRLAHLEGAPHKEIAARLSISEANARMLLSRALARLARLLEQ
jgi:RNA polymerase sigma-70 factor (ECF subfamily)